MITLFLGIHFVAFRHEPGNAGRLVSILLSPPKHLTQLAVTASLGASDMFLPLLLFMNWR